MFDSSTFSLAKPYIVKIFKDENLKSIVVRVDEKGDIVFTKYLADIVDYIEKNKATLEAARKSVQSMEDKGKEIDDLLKAAEEREKVLLFENAKLKESVKNFKDKLSVKGKKKNGRK